MAKVLKRTISLTPEQAAFIDRKVADGKYASVSEVVRDGLRDLMEYDAAVERWLREEVVPTYDRLKAHPEEAVPLDEAFDEILGKLDKKKRKRA